MLLLRNVLGQQHIADVNQLRARSVGLMHYVCKCCLALHFMDCSMRHECQIGNLQARFGKTSFSQCCEHGKEVLHALESTPPMLSASKDLGLFRREYNSSYSYAL